MNTGLLHLHNALRWVILISLLMSIYKLYSKKDALKTSKVLLISSHSTLLLGLYQYFFGAVGYKMIQATGMGLAMKESTTRFWAVEHISAMFIAIVLITMGHISYKKTQNASKTTVLYVIALLLIVLAMPWPFREGIGRPWLPGMGT